MPPTIDGQVLAGTQEPIGQAPGSYVTGNAPSRQPALPAGRQPGVAAAGRGVDLRRPAAAGPRRPGRTRPRPWRAPVTADDQAAPGAARRLRAAQRDPGHDHGGREARERRSADRDRRPAAQADAAPGGGEPAPGRPAPAGGLGARSRPTYTTAPRCANGYWTGTQDVAARPAALRSAAMADLVTRALEAVLVQVQGASRGPRPDRHGDRRLARDPVDRHARAPRSSRGRPPS